MVSDTTFSVDSNNGIFSIPYDASFYKDPSKLRCFVSLTYIRKHPNHYGVSISTPNISNGVISFTVSEKILQITNFITQTWSIPRWGNGVRSHTYTIPITKPSYVIIRSCGVKVLGDYRDGAYSDITVGGISYTDLRNLTPTLFTPDKQNNPNVLASADRAYNTECTFVTSLSRSVNITVPPPKYGGTTGLHYVNTEVHTIENVAVKCSVSVLLMEVF